MFYRFHITVHARPQLVLPGEPIELNDAPWQRLVLLPEQVALPFAISFETAAAALDALPRMFIEPDGSFVWVSSQGESPAWQIDGALYDRDGRLLYVDLKGEAPSEAFDRLLGCLGWPDQGVMMQLVRHAVFFDEEEFRRWATHRTTSDA